jgi:hypothetical protein
MARPVWSGSGIARQSRSRRGGSVFVTAGSVNARQSGSRKAGLVPGSAAQRSHGSVGHVGEGEGGMVNQGSRGQSC